jgi:predicted nucleotide-binding protein (sugar kinase/HSP70/actin superfamily)
MKPIEIGYATKYIFYPKMISVAQEDEISQKLRDAPATDKYQKEYEICLEALTVHAEKPAVKLVKEKGELVAKDIQTAEEFKERTTENERLIRDAFGLFKAQLSPDSRFLDS